MGYSFSIIHALAYSFVGMQTLYLATHFNPIYWNTACLIVNSGSLLQEEEEEENINNPTKTKKTVSTDYAKVARAIGIIQKAGIKIGLVDINKSQFSFIPDAENNQILFGLKGMLHVSDDIIKDIIVNRPYVSISDFLERVSPKKSVMISLIKGGAFDCFMERTKAMRWYLWETCDKKSKITMQNLAALISYDLLPKTEESKLCYNIYEFNRYLKASKKESSEYYQLDDRSSSFLMNNALEDLIELTDNGQLVLNIKKWTKQYQKSMGYLKDWITNNQDEIKEALNQKILSEDETTYASGNTAAWEMEVLCFYHQPHELAYVNKKKYGLTNYFDLPEVPVVESTTKWQGREIPRYKISKICGTCIAKNKMRNSISLLTPDGVVEVKFAKEFFAMFDKTISQREVDGKSIQLNLAGLNAVVY